MPGEPPDDQARIKALTEESKVLEEELIEVEAKNRLYTLLGERTRSASRLLPSQPAAQASVCFAIRELALGVVSLSRTAALCHELFLSLATHCSIWAAKRHAYLHQKLGWRASLNCCCKCGSTD